MTKFNKKQATLKRPKNFFISLISCFLLVLAFSTQSVVRGKVSANTVQFDHNAYSLTGTEGQTLRDVTLPDDFPTPSVSVSGSDNKIIKGTWAWEYSNTTLDTVGKYSYTAIFTPSDADYLDRAHTTGEVLKVL